MTIHRVGGEVLPAGRKDGQTPDDANIYMSFSKLLCISAPKTIKKCAYFLKTYDDIAPHSDHILSDNTVASISQILASIMQLQLTVIYFKLRRRDGLKQSNNHIKVRINQMIQKSKLGIQTRAHIHTELSYRPQLNCFILGLNICDNINISVPELALLKKIVAFVIGLLIFDAKVK
jgi:hypothetical protein